MRRGLPALLLWLAACGAPLQAEPLRGDYSFGHEVNVFCAQNNSRCYWLGPGSSAEARKRLRQIYEDAKPGLYEPVCVVLDGEIDRESPRDGFAAAYDGLIDVSEVQGACDAVSTILPGDLNHRRWVLRSPGGSADADAVVLDFGERLYLEGRDGCQSFEGFSRLDASHLVLDGLDFDRSNCDAAAAAASVIAHWPRWRITRAQRQLVLQHGDTRLVFERRDWR